MTRFAPGLRRNDIPINHMVTDDETAQGWNFELIPLKPVASRFVRCKVTPRHILAITEVQILDSIKYEPFDLRITLPR